MKWLAWGRSPIGVAYWKEKSTMAEAPAKEFSPQTNELAEKLVNLTVKEAQSLVDCLKTVHGIEPAGGGVVMAAAGGPEGGPGAAAEEEQTQFDVILAGFGDKKIQVIKVVRALTSLGLKEAKDLVESCPAPLKEAISREEADKIKADIEEAGGAVTIK
jgi:large subunit ribosomal protein L7/L12